MRSWNGRARTELHSGERCGRVQDELRVGEVPDCATDGQQQSSMERRFLLFCRLRKRLNPLVIDRKELVLVMLNCGMIFESEESFALATKRRPKTVPGK